jgi:hypothetical protein
MSVESDLEVRTSIASSDLSAKQFYAIQIASSAGMTVANAAKAMDGILLDKPKAAQVGSYAQRGRCKAAISASQTVNVGDLLEIDTGGTLIPHASGTIVAKAHESLVSTAAVCIISVEILAPTTLLYS